MTPAYALKLNFITQKIDVGVQKIDGSAFIIYGIVIVAFSFQDKLGRIQFFKEIFLLIDTSIEVVLGMYFFSFFDVNIRFVEREITWKRYITAKTLSITQKVKLIGKKKFVTAALDADSEISIVHVAALNIKSINMAVYLSQATQIKLLKANKTLTTVPTKYFDYTNFFHLNLPQNFQDTLI